VIDKKVAEDYHTHVANDPGNGSASAWDSEYVRQGIPSSRRDDPSGVLLWTLANIRFTTDDAITAAVDLGCGTGRNAIALASEVKRVEAMDFSATALDIARNRPGAEAVTFVQGDVTKPLPFEDDSFDLATDIFVYFHQLADVDRASYRREISRILKPGGILLVSLATNNDGYYSTCDIGPLTKVDSSVRLTWDPVAGVGNILLSYQQLVAEFSDLFTLQMSWIKQRHGLMHGNPYQRETVGTLWAAK
jgi:SAM-dependent methyltransferase